MIELRRKIVGIVPYTAVYFPDDVTVQEVIHHLPPLHLTRLFFTPTDVEGGRCIVSRYLTKTVNSDLTQGSERLWKQMDNTCRRQIRRAEKLYDRIRIERNGSKAESDFMDLMSALAGRKEGVSTISDQRLAALRSNADVFILHFDQTPNCAHLFLRDEQTGRARLLHSANRRLEDRENARTFADLNRLLHWYEMQFYREQGFTTYDLGGITTDGADGIARFKASFGGEVVQEYVYLCSGLSQLAQGARWLFESFTQRGRQWRARREQSA